jgi:type II secretory pathway pseudopilin PulG
MPGPRLTTLFRPIPAARKGFTLVQFIALVAIVGLFAVALLRALIREIDVRYVRQERAALKACSEALLRGILRQHFIPDHTSTETGWATTVASETGADPGSIAQNSRRQPRILLIDPGDVFGPGGAMTPPYWQSLDGKVWQDSYNVLPKRARFILTSSVGRPLPNSLSPGLMSAAADFETLWNTAPGASPAISALAGFPPADLVLERLDLSPHILMCTLTTDSIIPTAQGRYLLGTNAPSSVTLQLVDDRPRLFLENTLLTLYHSIDYNNQNLTLDLMRSDSQHVLIRGASFQYQGHVWVSGETGGSMYGGLDLAAVARQFLTSVPNLNAPTNQQQVILNSMINFMRDYVAWKESGNWLNNGYYNQVLSDQQTMLLQMQRIFLGSGNPSYYPFNNIAPCP